MKKNELAKSVYSVINGLKVEKWLRVAVLKSILSMRFLPNANGEISDFVNNLECADRDRFIQVIVNARARIGAQVDFIGAFGIPFVIALFTVTATFSFSVTAVLFISLLGAYMIIFFYYRLMKASIESILECLRIPSEYPKPTE